MTGKRISELGGVTTPLTLKEILPAVQAGNTVGIALDQIRGGRVVSINDFGAVGDGVTDDTAAFQALHGQLRDEQKRYPDLHAVVTMPPGHYRYTWNRWLWGLRDVTVLGYGARLQCVAKGDLNLDKYPLVTNRNGFQSMQPGQPGQGPQVDGALIDTARPGATSVRLKQAGEAGRFVPGAYVLILSYDQQFAGYPPNCRHFDYAKVLSVSGAVITLDRPLHHEHSDSYPELGEGSMGRARILDIDRDDVPFARRQTLLGLTLLGNPDIDEDPSQYLLAQGVRSFTARDCNLVSFVCSVGRDFLLANSMVTYCEPDKLVETVSLVDSQIGTLTQATGVQSLSARQCTFQMRANVQARVATFDSCIFNGAAQPGEYQRGVDLIGFAPITAVNVVNSTFFGKDGPTDTALSPVGTPAGVFASIPLSAPARLVADRALFIPNTDERAKVLLRNASIGDCLWIGGQTGGELYCDGRYAVLEQVKAGDGGVTFELSFSAKVTDKDMLIVPRVQNLRCSGNRFTSLGSRVPVACDVTFDGAVSGGEVFSFRRKADFPEEICSVTGYLRAVSLHVLRPYSGADPDAFLRIEQRTPANPAFSQNFDLRRVGTRRISLDGAPTVGDRDAVVPLKPDQFVWSVRLSHGQTPSARSAAPAGGKFDLAEYIVRFETTNPFRQF